MMFCVTSFIIHEKLSVFLILRQSEMIASSIIDTVPRCLVLLCQTWIVGNTLPTVCVFVSVSFCLKSPKYTKGYGVPSGGKAPSYTSYPDSLKYLLRSTNNLEYNSCCGFIVSTSPASAYRFRILLSAQYRQALQMAAHP